MDENSIIEVSVAPEVKKAVANEFVDEFEKLIDGTPEAVTKVTNQMMKIPEEEFNSFVDGIIRMMRRLEVLGRVNGYARLSDFVEMIARTDAEELGKILFDDEDDFDD